jgi:hypothetical protein
MEQMNVQVKEVIIKQIAIRNISRYADSYKVKIVGKNLNSPPFLDPIQDKTNLLFEQGSSFKLTDLESGRNMIKDGQTLYFDDVLFYFPAYTPNEIYLALEEVGLSWKESTKSWKMNIVFE